MTTAIDVSFLGRLCDGGGRATERTIGRPYSTTIDGAAWAYGTDGRHLVAVRGATGLPDAAENKAPQIEKLLLPLPTGQAVPLASIKAWADDPQWHDRDAVPDCVKCDVCRGRGVIEGDCHHCGRQEDEDCPECNGEGELNAENPLWPDRRYGVIFGRVVERERFARCLDAFTDETVTIGQQSEWSAIFVHTPGWVVMVMPIRDESPDGYPVFAA